MKQGTIKILTDTNESFGGKSKFKIETVDGVKGLIWFSKQKPEWGLKVGDTIQYKLFKDDTTYRFLPKFADWQKLNKPMYNNYNKVNNQENDNSQEYVNPQEIKDNNIFYQSARNCVSQIYSGHGDNVDINKIVELTEYLYNKHKNFFNK